MHGPGLSVPKNSIAPCFATLDVLNIIVVVAVAAAVGATIYIANPMPKPDCTADSGKRGFAILSECYAADITKLNLSGSDLSSLALIRGLTNLKKLYIDNTGITDLSPIGGLPKLTGLDLNGRQYSAHAEILAVINKGAN